MGLGGWRWGSGGARGGEPLGAAEEDPGKKKGHLRFKIQGGARLGVQRAPSRCAQQVRQTRASVPHRSAPNLGRTRLIGRAAGGGRGLWTDAQAKLRGVPEANEAARAMLPAMLLPMPWGRGVQSCPQLWLTPTLPWVSSFSSLSPP